MDSEQLLPKGYIFNWRSGILLSTRDNLATKAEEITSALANYGVVAAMAQSGGGSVIPTTAHLTASIRVQTPRTEIDIRSRLEREVNGRFTVLGVVTDLWERATESGKYVATETAKDIKTDVNKYATGFGITTAIILAVVGIAILIKLK